MPTGSNYIVLGMMPFFEVQNYDISKTSSDALFDRLWEQFIAGSRDYGRFVLRPVILEEPGIEYARGGWSTEPQTESFVAVSAPRSLYHLECRDVDLSGAAIADCMSGMRTLLSPSTREEYVLVPIDVERIGADRRISLGCIQHSYETFIEELAGYVEPEPMFDSRGTNGFTWDQELWSLTAANAGHEQVVYAALFLTAAFERLTFRGDDFERAIRRSDERSRRVREAVDVENSIHNCYKVVEAVYGGTLPKDWGPVEHRFREIGVDLRASAKVTSRWGALGNDPRIDTLKRLRRARDDRAAHGRIHANRRSTYNELMLYQVLAMNVLIDFIRHLHTDRIFRF